ncbi:hypothetical protein B5F39_06780 [Cloacibacillus sp. An23]|nr:hypothetical protein B5F39_06780 [Cloacibacillus sp. An23]
MKNKIFITGRKASAKRARTCISPHSSFGRASEACEDARSRHGACGVNDAGTMISLSQKIKVVQ